MRNFKFHKVIVDGKPRTAMRIECATCGKVQDFHQTSASRLPPIAAEQHFRRDGWTVGKVARRDYCPACTEKMAARDKAPVEKKETIMATSPSQTPPRQMTTEDRRVVFKEIEGVWDEKAKCYMDDWLDEAVAKSLGAHVPVAWVRDVRATFFGGENTNLSSGLFMSELAGAEKQMAALAQQLDALRIVAKKLDARK